MPHLNLILDYREIPAVLSGSSSPLPSCFSDSSYGSYSYTRTAYLVRHYRDKSTLSMESAPGAGKASSAAQPAQDRQPNPRPATTESFLGATSIAWGHLQPAERKAIRACCRAGRLQHDGLVTDLQLTLGHIPPDSAPDDEDGDPEPIHPSPTPAQVRTAVQGVVGRGARLQSLTVHFQDGRERQRQGQLLAALEACSGWPLPRLEFLGAVPLSGTVVEAVSSCCPHIACLRLDLSKCHMPQEAEAGRAAAAERPDSVTQLLVRCGPRLRALRLRGVRGVPALSYDFLRECTALTELELNEARCNPCVVNYPADPDEFNPVARDPAAQSAIYNLISQLRGLQSLDLHLSSSGAAHSPDAVRSHATRVGQLSALTALTSLKLELPYSCQGQGDSWQGQQQEQEGDQHTAWREAREAHRTSLLSMLRCMPQLQHLDCPTLWLRPAEAASLAALTSLTMQGMLPPWGAPGHAQRGAAGATAASGALPPQLRKLALNAPHSPQVLALLQPPACFAVLDVPGLQFGVSDVDAEGRLRPEAVAAVGPAVRLVVAFKKRTPYRDEVCITNHSGPGGLLPREGAPNGHSEWIRQLQGLDVFAELTLRNLELRTGDLACLGQTLPRLTGLKLWGCSFPLAALPAVRSHMLQLTLGLLDLSSLAHVTRDELESVLVLLCRPLPGAPPLRQMLCCGCGPWADAAQCRQSVLRQLEVDFGVSGTQVIVVN